MTTSDHEELGIKLLARPSSDSLTSVPIKKRRFMLTRSPSSSSDISSSLPANCDVPQKSPEPDSSVSETCNQPAFATTLTSKSTCESRVESTVSKDLNVALEHGILPLSDHLGLRPNMDVMETSHVKELTPDNICALLSVSGSTQLLSSKEPFEVPVEGSGEENSVSSDTRVFPTVLGNTELQLAFKEPAGLPVDGQNSGSFVKQAKLDSCSWNLALAERQQNLQSKCNGAESEADSDHLHLNRSNWDLNTTMDTWEDMLSDSSLDNETGGHDSLDIGAIQNKRFELDPVQMLFKEPDGAENNDDQPGSSNVLTSMNEGSRSEACLVLQLKPSFMVESLLSLSVKPSSSDCHPTHVDCRNIKAEPYREINQKDNRKNEVGDLESASLKLVKTEPCERQEPPKRIDPSDLKSACRRPVKSEPLEDQDQGFLKRHNSLTHQSTDAPHIVAKPVSKALDSLVPDGIERHNSLQLPNAMMPQDPSQTTGKALELVTEALIPHNNALCHGGKMPISFHIPQYGKGPVTKFLDSVQESLISKDKELNLFEEAHKMAGLTSESPSESFLSDVKENMVAYRKSEIVDAQMYYTDGCNSSRASSADELHIDSFGKSKAAESSEGKFEQSAEVLDRPRDHERESNNSHLDRLCDHEKESNNSHDNTGAVDTVLHNQSLAAESSEGKFEQSAEVLDRPCDHEKDSKNSHDKPGAVDTVLHKQCGDDDDYEDGEVRHPTLHGTVEGSCEESKDNQVKAADSFCPVDVPVDVPSFVELKVDKIENPDTTKINGVESGDGGQKDNPGISTTSNLHDSSADCVLKSDSARRRLGKTIRKIPREKLKDKGTEREPKSDMTPGTRIVTKGSHDEVSNRQENALLLDKVSILSKTEVSVNCDAKKIANDKGSRSHIVNLNPPDGLISRKPKSILSRLTLPRIEKKGLIEKSLRREKSRFGRIRDEKSKYISQILECERSKDQPVRRRASNLMHPRSRTDNQLNAKHVDRNSDNEHALEQVHRSTGSRFPRPINTSEVALGVASDGSIGNAGRMARNLMDEELQNLSHMQGRRWSPGGRGHIPVGSQMIRHPVRDISPTSYSGRDYPDFLHRAHEERLARTLPDDMMTPPMVPRPCSQYERVAGNLIHRERSLSPVQRRVPLQFPPVCSRSSPRSQAHPHHQWSPPRRSPDGFNGPPEFMARAIRPDRMRPPHQHPCFAEDMIVRRRGSPPYIARISDSLVDMGPSRERDIQRPVRDMQRNIRRFDTIDPREIPEEYFGPSLHNQFGELAGDVECVDSCNERHERRVLGPSRSFRQRRTLSDDDNESFRSHVDDGPSGPLRFCPEGNGGFPERGSPRDYEGHIRNRLGSRLKGIEEREDNYSYHGEPGWGDTSVADVRLRRRRLEKHRGTR